MPDSELAFEDLLEKLSLSENHTTQAIQKEADSSNLAPSGPEETTCLEAQLSSGPWSSELKEMDDNLRSIEEQLQYLLGKADEFHNRLIYSKDNSEKDEFARVVPTILKTCKPYFSHLESTARNTSPSQATVPQYIRNRLLQISQQLCSRLEQLILTYASYGHVSLVETDPLSVSHFYIGQCQVLDIKLSIFRYCKPSPFVGLARNGLYKHMRWNVERKKQTESRREGGKDDNRTEVTLEPEREPEAKRHRKTEGNSTEYYFLCHEDILLMEDEAWREQTDRKPEEEAVFKRMWSIGKWVQTYPDPDNEDISDWLSCIVAQGEYKMLAYLGADEPSACIATNCLLGMLLFQTD